jgi:hypothetical protein
LETVNDGKKRWFSSMGIEWKRASNLQLDGTRKELTEELLCYGIWPSIPSALNPCG